MKKQISLIRRGREASALQRGLPDGVLAGTSSIFSALSKAADIVPLDEEELFGMLHFRLHTSGLAKARSRYFWGRFYNHFSGDDPDYIPLSGSHLRQVAQAAGLDISNQVELDGQYLLSVDLAQQAYNRLAVERSHNNRD